MIVLTILPSAIKILCAYDRLAAAEKQELLGQLTKKSEACSHGGLNVASKINPFKTVAHSQAPAACIIPMFNRRSASDMN